MTIDKPIIEKRFRKLILKEDDSDWDDPQLDQVIDVVKRKIGMCQHILDTCDRSRTEADEEVSS